MSEKDCETLSKLHDISFHIALQRLLFTAFQNQIAKPMKMKMFVRISFLEFPNICLKRTKRKKFITILCDGSTDNSIIEQNVLYVIFTDPETFKPTMKFFKVVAPADSQDAPGLKNAIFATFHKHSLESVLRKIVFLSSDGASVNSGKDLGANQAITRRFSLDLSYLVF